MSHEPARQVQLRRDLEHSLQQQQGKTYLVVKDPVTRRYFRFTEVQASIMGFFKEAPEDIATIASLASDKLNTTISTTTIDAFCKSLDEKFLLETPEVREKLGAIQGQQLEGRNFLYWKIASVDPERIFAWLLPRTEWAFKPSIQLLALLTIFTGFTITYLNWRSLSGAAPALFSIYGLLLIWPVVFTVTTIHEFSHGLTCCHYGGKVHEVGFMLIYFSPAFYCDVSDSYMFPRRTSRMAVALAGGFVQLTVWGICTMVWRLTDSNAFINQLALIVVVFSGLQTLVNFNPLIKLDGYYMLSDFLEVPNLRAKALRSFWDWIAGNGKSSWSYRDKRAQLVYGAASAVFSTSLLVYVYSALYTWATSKYALAGFVVFGVFANFTLRKALVEPMEGVKAVASRASVKRYRNMAIVLTLLILSVVLRWELRIPANFKIIPLNESIVRATTSGVVVDVLVQESSKVKGGDVVARMADFGKDEKDRDLSGQLQFAKDQLKIVQNGTRPQEIAEYEAFVESRTVALANVRNNKERRAQLQAALAAKNTSLDLAQAFLIRGQESFNKGLISRDDFEKFQNSAKLAGDEVRVADAEIKALEEKENNDYRMNSTELSIAQRHLELLKAGSRSDQIQLAENEVIRLESQLEDLTRERKKTNIVADIAGVVTTERVETRKGWQLNPGDELMRLVDTSNVKAQMTVPEKDLECVQSENYVRMKLNSFPDQEFEGRVYFVAQIAQTENGQQIVTVRATLSNPGGILKPNLTGVAKIYCGKRRIIEIMTYRIHRWIRTEFWDLWP